MIFRFNRRSFLRACAIVPFIQSFIQSKGKARLQEIVSQIKNPKILVVYYDFWSATQIIGHLGVPIIFSVPGASMAVPSNQASIEYHPVLPGRTNVNEILTGVLPRNYAVDLVLLQDSRKYGTFTVLKNCYAKHGETLNVFTPTRSTSVSNV